MESAFQSARPARDQSRTRRRSTRAGMVAAIILAAAASSAVRAAEAVSSASVTDDEVNYSVGYAFGAYLAGLKLRGTEVDLEAVLKGTLDALSGAEPMVGEAERRQALDALQATVAAAEPPPDSAPQEALVLARTRGHMDDFAVLNAKRPGVIVLPSGVQYEVLGTGTGKQPDSDDTVTISYEGTLTNGIVFDTTYEDGEPLRVRIDALAVPGLREALLRMRQGDKWRVVVPPAMGFGKTGNNQLRKRDLIYEIELVSVMESGQDAPPDGGPVPADTAD